MSDFVLQRRMMVDCQLRPSEITDGRILDVMGAVPRERFVAPSDAVLAYADQSPAASTGERGPATRYLLTPMVLGRLLQAARITPGCRVLDVAAGTGYATAVITRLGGAAVALESDGDLVRRAESLLAETAPGAEVARGALSSGWIKNAPYDVIVVEGSFEVEPAGLFGQLAEGGRLVGIKGNSRAGRAMLYRKTESTVSGRPMFDAAAPALAEFRAEPAFVF